MQDMIKLVYIIHQKEVAYGLSKVPKSVTLNGVIAVIVRYFTEFRTLGRQLCQAN